MRREERKAAAEAKRREGGKGKREKGSLKGGHGEFESRDMEQNNKGGRS